MRIFAQPAAFYRNIRVDMTTCPEAKGRLETLRRIDELVRSSGCTLEAAARSQGLSRTTCYRWRKALGQGGLAGLAPKSSRPRSRPGRRWNHADAERVLAIRRRRPFEGKLRIHHAHNKRHPERPLSLATVGRIISWAIDTGRIPRCDFVERGKPARKRDFDGQHAQRWTRADRHRGVQFDHMTISIDGKQLKEFRAVCPATRRQHAKVYTRATSTTAAAFLKEAAEALGVDAAQVDGGSEFMGKFDEACQKQDTPLIVLPPRCPELNGIVERANRTARIECWGTYTGPLTCEGMNAHLRESLAYYNGERPHRALGMMTPNEFATMRARVA